MYTTLEELYAGYSEIPEDERSNFPTYCEQMVELGIYSGPAISLYDVENYDK